MWNLALVHPQVHLRRFVIKKVHFFVHRVENHGLHEDGKGKSGVHGPARPTY